MVIMKSKLMNKYLKALTMISICAGGLCLITIVFLVAKHYPTNHIGLDVRWLYLLGIPLAIFGIILFLWSLTSRIIASIAAATGLSLCCVLVILDHYNILVQYEEWLHRGMPLPFG